MPCNPNLNALNPPFVPGIPIPGFGIPFSPIQLPIPDFEFPEGFPEDLLNLIDSLGQYIKGMKFDPQLDDLSNTIMKAIASILSQLAPFLALYNFFQALLNMVLCILEVMCAIPNPWKMIKAIRRLFKRCLPQFLSLFPWLALLAMIIALLQLLLALIEYIINKILELIKEIIRNLTILAEGVSLSNDDATIAAAQKIAQLLCLLDNLLAIFVAIGSIMAIIESLAGIQGRSVCGNGNGFGDNVDCCDDDVCPPFIRNNPEGITGSLGKLIYHKKVGVDTQTLFSLSSDLFSFPPLRDERWQFVDEEINPTYSFKDIITTSSLGNIFFPELTYASDTNTNKVPYTVDLELTNFDPSIFHTSDVLGARDFLIEDCIVYKKPYIGVLNYRNVLDTTDANGTFSFLGGKVFEKDGSPFLVNNVQATLETFIHQNDLISSGGLPIFDDGYEIANVNYTLNINHPSLVDLSLITIGCSPDIEIEREIANLRVSTIGTNGFDSVFNRVGPLPNVNGAANCAFTAVDKFRKDVSIENAAIFQAEILSCLNGLRDESIVSLTSLIKEGASQFESQASIDPSLQVLTKSILVSLIINDSGGNSIINNLPEEVATSVESSIVGSVTLGNISNFKYDGYGKFDASITSSLEGDGYVTISINNNSLQKILNSDDDTQPTIIEDNKILYTFVTGVTEGLVGRDEVDIAVDG